MNAPKPVRCPECKAPAVARLSFPVFCMAAWPFFDDEGREHFHDPNGSGVGFRCGNGHEWGVACRCWCGWSDGGDHLFPTKNAS